jgi:hypothetical protein
MTTMRAPEIPASVVRSAGKPASPGQGPDTSLQEVSDRFTSLFYRRLLESMMSTIPGREKQSAMGGAGWTFMKRYLPRTLSRGGQDTIGQYISESLQSRPGGKINARM